MTNTANIGELAQQEYKHGFVTDIEEEKVPIGLNEGIIATISRKKDEPGWMLEWRLKAYNNWLKMKDPIHGRDQNERWAMVSYPKIDYNNMIYYAAPKQMPNSLDEVDPKILETYNKLGIPLQEQKMLSGIAVDAVFDSVSVATTFQDKRSEERRVGKECRS